MKDLENGRGKPARRRSRLSRRSPALLSLMLMWGGGPQTDPALPPLGAAASGCVSLEAPAPGMALGFGSLGRALGTCTATRLPLMHDTMVGGGTLFSDLELANLDVQQMTAQEVRLKFGVSRDMLPGLHASIDGSIGRVLGSLSPIFDEHLHAIVTRPIDAHWETGLEGRLGALGAIGLTQLTERTALIFLRTRYTIASSAVSQHSIELKLSGDSWEVGGLGSARHARADCRYEFRRDANILSVGFDATATEGSNSPSFPTLAIDVRATRPF